MIDQTIQSFTIRKKLGSGGMATVYLAENSIGKKAAVKVLHKKYFHDEQVHKRFVQEAKVMANLEHDHICSVISLEDNDQFSAIIMEYLPGEDLKSHLDRHGTVPEEQVTAWLRQIAPALHYAHGKGYVHRDIKPSNFLLTAKGQIKIMDFGIAKAQDSMVDSRTEGKMGSLMYISPEQLRSAKHVDRRTDIYSLGVTLHHLLSGRNPYDITTHSDFDVMLKVEKEELCRLPVSEAMNTLIQQATAKDREQRPDKMPDLLDMLPQAPHSSEVTIPYPEPTNEITLPYRVDDTPADHIVPDGEVIVVDEKDEDEEPKPPLNNLDRKKQEEKDDKPVAPPKTPDKKTKKPSLTWVYVVVVILLGGGGLAVIASQYFPAESKQSAEEAYQEAVEADDSTAYANFINEWADKEEAVVWLQLASAQLDSLDSLINLGGENNLTAGPINEAMLTSNMTGQKPTEETTPIETEPEEVGETILSVSMPLPAKEEETTPTPEQVQERMAQYDRVWDFSEGLAPVKKGGKEGFVDKNGKVVIPLVYDFADIFSEGRARVKKDGKWGFIDKNGKVVIPLMYDNAYSFSEGLAPVKKDGEWFDINRQGERVD